MAITLDGTLGLTLPVPLTPTNGGTGLSSVSTGALPYGAGTSAMNTLSLGTQGFVLVAGAAATTWSGFSGGTF